MKTRELTSTSASVHPSGLPLSSGILGSFNNPYAFATPTRSKFLIRNTYDASCFEYARTNETKALVALSCKSLSLRTIDRISSSRGRTSGSSSSSGRASGSGRYAFSLIGILRTERRSRLQRWINCIHISQGEGIILTDILPFVPY